MKKSLISVVGPTAIGKTTLSIGLAKHFKTAIISADSRQFFKEMNIGTAVPSNTELHSVPHHFIRHKSVLENYSVGDFEKEAIEKLEELFKEHDVVIMVGGSGLYVDAVTKGLDMFPKVDPEIRISLNEDLQEKGLPFLQDQLKELDPDYFEKVDLENPHRVIRALEVCISSGQPYSTFLGNKKSKRSFHTISVGITADREVIYDRINQRVDLMMEEGLLDEVKSVYNYKDLNALQTVGYRELFKHLDGEWDLDFAISEIKKNTRRFAKRQLTWFKKNETIFWVDYQYKLEDVIKQVKTIIKTILNE